jgi:urease accessory protein
MGVSGPRVRQRANGALSATFARTGGRTEPQRLFETGGLRWRFPRAAGPCQAAIVNVGGGVAGGDAYRIDLTLRGESEVEATTTAAERVYRSEGPSAHVETHVTLEARSRLGWLPQETILFDGAQLERCLTFDLNEESSLLAVESIVFGRLAMGETRIDARLRDSWRVTRDSRLIYADETRLSDAGAVLDRNAVGAGARALVTVLAAAPDVESKLPGLRAAFEVRGADVEAGASFFDDLIIARLLSPSPARLRAVTIAAILALGGQEPPRLWQ